MNDFEKLVTGDIQAPYGLMMLNARINALDVMHGLQDRSEYTVCYSETDLVKDAMSEFGREAVIEASHLIANAQYVFVQCLRGVRLTSAIDNDIIGLVSMRKQQYFVYLHILLADAYMADTSKIHLQQYVDNKFGADLGL